MVDRKRRVLVVEDEAPVRDLVIRHLEKQGHEVVGAADAEQVLLRMSRDRAPFDLVLSDVHLPGLSGVELLRLLLTHSPLRPVIMITGDHDEALARRALSFGAAGYLLKPFELFELDGVVRQALARLDLMEATQALAREGVPAGDPPPSGTRPGAASAPDGQGPSIPDAWLDLADGRSGAGAGHGHRVARMAGVMASSLGSEVEGDAERAALDAASRSHELGRLLGPASSPAELGARTAQLLQELGAGGRVLNIVNHMRERWDGSGGPNGMHGREIPLPSRVLAAADALDHGAVAGLESGSEPGEAIARALERTAQGAADGYGPEVADALTGSSRVLEAVWVLTRGPDR